MKEKTKVKIVGGAASRTGKIGIVTTTNGTGKNAGKIEIYIERSDRGHYWYDRADLEVIEEPPAELETPKFVNLKIKLIRIDGGTQIREKINNRTVEEYAEDMKNGATFPPIIVFLDSSGEYWLSDGFHRVLAAGVADREEINAEVRQGELREAILFSCGANATHGLRRTNKDKRNSVLKFLSDRDWTKFSNNQISKICGVSHTFVNKLRGSLETVSSETISRKAESSLETNSSEKNSNLSRTYITKHGSIATMDTSNIGKSSAKEIIAGCQVKVKDTYGVYPGQIGTISYFVNNNNAMVVFDDNQTRLIPRSQLELIDLPTSDSSLDDTTSIALSTPAHDEKQEFTSIEEELDAKQEELGLGTGGESVLPETDKLDELQHSNPTEVDDRPFVNPIVEEINPKSLVNNLAIHATELGKDDYRSIGKIIASTKPEAIEDVAEMMADSKEKARSIVQILTNKYPDLLVDLERF